MLLNLPIILSRIFLNSPVILKIIPTKIELYTKIHAKLLISTKTINHYMSTLVHIQTFLILWPQFWHNRHMSIHILCLYYLYYT